MGFLHDYSCVLVAHPKNKQAYVAVTWPGLIGVLSGMNDQGVSLAVMVVHDEKGCAPGVPFGLAFRRALEQSKSAKEVSVLLSHTALTVSNNLMVVDGGGTALLLELASADPRVVERVPDKRGLIFSTNHFLSPERKQTRMSLTYLSSVSRLRSVETACAKKGAITVPVAITALRAGAAGVRNVQSMIFLPKSGKLYVALGKTPAAQHEFVELDPDVLLNG
jgi:isopenicillin-N N-acyltransferase like protein